MKPRSRGIRRMSWFAPPLALIAGAIAVAALCPSIASARSTVARTDDFTLFAAPNTAQFMNHADDRLRGMSANPFTPSQKSLVQIATGNEKKGGPFPGDDVLYTFKLYHDSGLTKSAGTATLTCYYSFSKAATCEAYFALAANRELIAEGQIKFQKPTFALTVSGGIGSDVGDHGQVLATGLGSQALAERLHFSVSTGSSTVTKPSPLKLYSVANQVQYINNADDEARGEINNPFGTSTNKLRPKLSWKGNGPFPGDVAVYSFTLYSDSALKKRDGTAVYICYFNYNKRAFCDTDVTLGADGGTIVASGPVNFLASSYSVVVTGGTLKHDGSRGQLFEKPLAKRNAEQITISFV